MRRGISGMWGLIRRRSPGPEAVRPCTGLGSPHVSGSEGGTAKGEDPGHPESPAAHERAHAWLRPGSAGPAPGAPTASGTLMDTLR